jgi:hypothetical protein
MHVVGVVHLGQVVEGTGLWGEDEEKRGGRREGEREERR